MISVTKRGQNKAVKEQSFCTLLQLGCYKFKLGCYNFRMLDVIHMETTRGTAVEYTQKEFKYLAKKKT